MNFKKRFDKRIEEDKKSMLTESDRAFLATLQDMVVERPQGEVLAKPFNYKKPLIISVACFMVAALTVFLILWFALPAKPNGKVYFEDNFVEVRSDVTELNSDLILFSFEADENYSVDISKVYDSVSNDTLYYKLKMSDDYSVNIRLEIVVNKNYIHSDMAYWAETTEDAISGYTIKYAQTITPLAGMPFNTVNCMGEMQIGNQWIYIMSYEEMSLTEGTFIETLQSMIHFK